MKVQEQARRKVRMLKKFKRRFGLMKVPKPLSESEFEERRQKLQKSLRSLSVLDVDNGTTL